MGKFAGGSAFGMARDIAEGYCSVSDRTFRSSSAGEVVGLERELERNLRELRGQPIQGEELGAIQSRNRRIQRLNAALVVLRSYRSRAGR